MKIDIVTGFLGAGKTTLIKKLIDHGYKSEKVAIIENEFGEVSIDGDLLKGKNVDIKEISTGCICCSIAGDFEDSVIDILKKYELERLIIEPSGVAKVSDIISTCRKLGKKYNSTIENIYTVIDVSNYDMYINNFGEFYKDQVLNGKTIILTRTDIVQDNIISNVTSSIRKLNKSAKIIAVPMKDLTFEDIRNINDIDENIEKSLKISSSKTIFKRRKTFAENIFNSFGLETTKSYSKVKLNEIFDKIDRDKDYGFVLRGKGLVKSDTDSWLEFHYTPGQFVISEAKSKSVGKIAIIGEKINKNKMLKLFS